MQDFGSLISALRQNSPTAFEKVPLVEETFEPVMGKLGGSPTRCSPEPAFHLAPADGPRGADGRRQQRIGRAGVGLFAEKGARAPRPLQKILEA